MQDLKSALRALRRRPAHAAHVVVALALGMGAFSGLVAYLSYFTRPLIEAPDPGRLAWVFRSTPDDPHGQLSQPDFYDLSAARPGALRQLAGWRAFGAAVRGPARTVHGWGHAVSGDFFDLFGARPSLGRLLAPADDRAGAPRVLVVSHRFWRTHLGADPRAIGTDVVLDGGQRYTLVGVTEPGFQGPALGMSLYVPLATADGLLAATTDRDASTVSVMARRARSTTPGEAAGGLAGVARGLDATHPLDAPRRFDAVAVADYNAWPPDDPLVRGAQALTLAVTCLLLLACANIGNLLLASVTARERDFAVQAALGAGRPRLVRQLCLEGLLLAMAGGVLGLPLVRPVLAVIEGYLLDTVPVGMGEWAQDTHLVVDPWFVGGASLLMMGAVAVVTTVAPAFALGRRDLVASLRADAVSGVGGRLIGRRVMVIGQVALSVVLLVGTGLFLQTLEAARGAPRGFQTDGRTLATVHVPPGAVDGAGPAVLFGRILDDVRALPGVHAASLVSRVPGGAMPMELRVSGPGRDVVRVTSNIIASGYFDSLGIDLADGRDFDARDGEDGAPRVAIVTAMAAARLWPGQDAVGQRLDVHTTPEAPLQAYQVVGVAADSLTGPPARPFEPHVYLYYRQAAARRLTLVVSADASLPQRLHDLLRSRYPELAVLDVQPFSEQFRRGVADLRLNADVASGLGVLGLLLAVQGLFSLMSYSVARRAREIGLRKALGADRAAVGRLVLAEASRLIAAGLLIGGIGAAAFARVLQTLIAGLDAGRPASLAAALASMTLFGLLAAAVPAWRAARVDPAASMRSL
ncbi:MAG: ABC transporter permease [Vicinamibacterales bacterium]